VNELVLLVVEVIDVLVNVNVPCWQELRQTATE
jgi:hypothetical protein